MSDSESPVDFSRDEFSAALRTLVAGFWEWADSFLERATAQPGRTPAMLDAAERTLFFQRMLQTYDFVTTGVWDTTSVEEFGHEIANFRQLCQIELETPVGVELAPSTDSGRALSPRQMCSTVLDHAEARLALLRGESIGLGAIALLAGLAEKTVRMAANPKGKDPLLIVKDGHRTFVLAEVALRWLSTKPGFRPTVMRDDPSTPRTYGSLDGLAWHCRKLREAAGLSLPDLFRTLRWGRALQAAYRQLEEGSPLFDPRPLSVEQLARYWRALGVGDVAQFTRNAALVLAPIAIERQCQAVLN